MKIEMNAFDKGSRSLFITDDINPRTAAVVVEGIEIINRKDDTREEMYKEGSIRKPITLYINSYGGIVYDMLTILGAMDNSKAPIYTVCTGYAMSAAFIIFCAGVKRTAYRYATFMYHELFSHRAEKLSSLMENLIETDRLQREMDKIVTRNTKISSEMLDSIRQTKQDRYFNYQEAKEYGIIN